MMARPIAKGDSGADPLMKQTGNQPEAFTAWIAGFGAKGW